MLYSNILAGISRCCLFSDMTEMLKLTNRHLVITKGSCSDSNSVNVTYNTSAKSFIVNKLSLLLQTFFTLQFNASLVLPLSCTHTDYRVKLIIFVVMHCYCIHFQVLTIHIK